MLAVAGLCALFAGADLAAAQDFPKIAARHRGSGSYENRGSQEKRELSEARVVLGEGGSASIELWGPKTQLAMRGRILKFNGREHVDIAFDTFDGVPTTAKGWIALDRRGGFERIEFDGQAPVRLGVSFRASGPNIEPPPPPPAPPPAPAGLTEERGFDRRGNDYVDFRARDLVDCQDSCRRDNRCQAYTFDTIDRTCWLKNRVNSQQRNRDTVTGYKE
jgi:hypothetical protein